MAVEAGAIPRLGFAVTDAARLDHAAAPALRFALQIESDGPVRSIQLDTQIQIARRATIRSRLAFAGGTHTRSVFHADRDSHVNAARVAALFD